MGSSPCVPRYNAFLTTSSSSPPCTAHADIRSALPAVSLGAISLFITHYALEWPSLPSAQRRGKALRSVRAGAIGSTVLIPRSLATARRLRDLPRIDDACDYGAAIVSADRGRWCEIIPSASLVWAGVACALPFSIHPIPLLHDVSIFNTHRRHLIGDGEWGNAAASRRQCLSLSRPSAHERTRMGDGMGFSCACPSTGSAILSGIWLISHYIMVRYRFYLMRIRMGRAQCPAHPTSTHSIPEDKLYILIAAAVLLAEA
ncbi:hypothetical protein B0H10DRAFT_2436986 [Mycena sp. CBHHK59/15]|nr:hypothetical protein B0H10DRAFT_2436986 [Mycena sp. CBHHK59/15]